MDHDHRSGKASMARWLLRLLLLAVISVVGFVMYFIVPRVEVYWRARGTRPPAWAAALVSSSHFTIKYWYLIVIASLLLFWLQRRAPDPPRE